MHPEQIKTLARECGFELAGIAAAAPVREAGYYGQWIAGGLAGEMGYLTDRRAGLRDDPRHLLPSARSILCVGKLYNGPQPYSTQFAGEDLAWISRYAWGEDYHQVLRRGLARVVDGLRALSPAPFEWKICVDTAPLLERAYARHAGLGWIAKNTCLINQAMGSWFFLGELLLSLDFAPEPAATRPVRLVYALHRRLPDASHRAHRAGGRSGVGARFAAMHFVLHHRAARRGVRRGAARHRTPRFWMRYLSGCVPVEPARAHDGGAGLRCGAFRAAAGEAGGACRRRVPRDVP
jgi:hypothetical protein